MSRSNRWPDGRVPVLLSAHGADLIGDDARALLAYLDRDPAAAVSAVAAQVAATRRVRRHRAVIRARDRAELADGLRAVTTGADHPLVARSADGTAPRIAFVLPGQGSQWPSMGADAYRQLADYRAEVDACVEAFVAAGAASPLRYLTTPDDAETFSETEIEGAQFTHGVALARVWQRYGVLPDVTVGHSLGEIGAAYIAGAITLSDAVAVVIARAGVVDRLPGRYAVAVLGVDADAARSVIEATPGWLELSVVNAPSSVAVSGDREAVSAAVAAVRARGRFAREITVGFPVHTSILEPLRDELLRRLPRSVFADTAVQFIGGTTGDVVPAGTAFGDYWYGNLRHLVRFDHAFAAALRCGARTFVELSAHPSLLFAMGDLLGDTAATLVGSGRRDEPITEALAANLAAVAVSDPSYGWRDSVGDNGIRLRGFPNAPMRATQMWAHPEPLPEIEALTVAHEVWQPVPAAPPGPDAPVAVAVAGLGAAGGLGARLRAAVDRHPGVTLATPDVAAVTLVPALEFTAPELDSSDVDGTVTAITEAVGAGALRYPAALGPHCRDVWLITVAAEQTRPDEPVAMPAAALAAMHRSLALENPELGFHHLDLPADPDALPIDALLIDALLIDTVLTGRALTDGAELAIRDRGAGPARFRRSLREVPGTPAGPLDLDNVVITGGAGEIGLHYARHLADQGARRIVLLSRRSVAPAVLAALREPHGAEVLSVPCDITDPDALAVAAERYGGRHGGEGASLLIHAAGAATFGTADRLDAAATAHTLTAKVTGLARMAELWPLRADARILACSSVSGLWGGHGHAAYSAANRMLDVLAQRLRADGRRCVAVRWGLWRSDTGSGIVDAAETARIERSGLRPMAPEAAIETSLQQHAADPLVFAADPHRLQLFFGSPEPARGTESGGGADAPVDAADAVRGELAAVLAITDPGAIDLDSSLFDLGVDSLLAIDLRKRVNRAIGRTVPLATLLSGITGAELVAELKGDHRYDRSAQKVDSPSD